MTQELSPFEKIRRTTSVGNEFWSSRDFAGVLGYTDYRNFEAVIEKARSLFQSIHEILLSHVKILMEKRET